MRYRLNTSVPWSIQSNVVNGSSNVARPFCDPNPTNEKHSVLIGLVKYAAFRALLFMPRKAQSKQFFPAVCIDGGPEQGGNINYASSSSTALKHALSNSHSCECIGPLRVSNQSEHNLHNSAQRSWQQLCKHANIRRTGQFLSLVFLLLCKSLGQSCLPTQSLWITQVQ